MLVVTIHDVAPVHLAAVRELRARVLEMGVSVATLLAVPNYHARGRLSSCPGTVSWLRSCAAAGDEIALHGVEHRAPGSAAGWRDRLRARVWTAGEGEMLGRSAPDPERLAAERDRLARLVEAPIRGFVAPAWLEPRGLAGALAALGFAWHETGVVLERLQDRTRTLAPTIGFATRSRWREHVAVAWCTAAVEITERMSSTYPARVALHPADLSSPRVMRAADHAIRRLVAVHPPVTTSSALAIA